MKPMTKFDELWTDYLEGELDDSKHSELRQHLNDPIFLEQAVEQFQLHRLLNLQAESGDQTQQKFVNATMSALPVSSEGLLKRIQKDIHQNYDSAATPGKRHHPKQWAWIAALAAGICFAAWLLMNPKNSPDAIEIAAMEGAITLTSNQSTEALPVESGKQFSTGTLELKTPDSWCELKFRDQTVTTISGPARVLLTGGKQKVIRLDRGRLSVDVTPQPHQLPLLVFTEAADLEAPGNRFNIEAESNGTRLVVNQGTVRIKRKMDGKVAEVPANHSIAASLDIGEAMTVFQRPDSVSSWKANLNTEARQGMVTPESEWLKKMLALAVKKGELSKTEALEKFKKSATLEENDSIWATPTPYGNLITLSVTAPNAKPVSIKPQAYFRITGRISPGAPLTIGFNTHRPQGGFSGKHAIKVDPADLKRNSSPNSSIQTDALISFALDLPVDRFMQKSKRQKEVVGNELSEWWCVTEGKNKLQILSVELLDSPAPNSVLPNSL